MDKLTRWNRIASNLTMLGQFGLSLVIPPILCMGACYYLVSRYSLSLWIYIPGLLFGLGASFMTAYKVYLRVLRRETPRRHRDIGFNKHV